MITRARATAGLVAVAAAAVVLLIVGAGGGGSGHRLASGPFAWLHPASPPAGWSDARIEGGATLAYPPGWTPIKTDPGTASAALLSASGRIEGYLNATPKQGTETLANWSRFRPRHNRGEDDTNVRLIASARNLRFRGGGRGSCVIDTYTTSKATYREIACLVSGRTSSAVIVAAARVERWKQQAPTLQRAVSSFTT
jgi:hypothetical protein